MFNLAVVSAPDMPGSSGASQPKSDKPAKPQGERIALLGFRERKRAPDTDAEPTRDDDTPHGA